jgi:hypothetical protein
MFVAGGLDASMASKVLTKRQNNPKTGPYPSLTIHTDYATMGFYNASNCSDQRQKREYSRWARIKLAVSTHNYSTIQLPTVGGTVINVRRPGIPEGVHINIYQKLGVDYRNLPITKNLA